MEAEIQTPLLTDNAPYAGFGIRLLAHLIDAVIMFFVVVVMFFLVSGLCKIFSGEDAAYTFTHMFFSREMLLNRELMTPVMIYMFLFYALVMLSGLIYNVGFNCSNYMGTPGKIAMNIKIVNVQGGRITVWRALGRFCFYTVSCFVLGLLGGIGRFLSVVVYWGGYLHIFIDTRKRGLHDIVCGTYVIYKFHTVEDKYEKFFDEK